MLAQMHRYRRHGRSGGHCTTLLQKMKSHLPILSNVKRLMYHRSPNTPSEIADDMLRPAKSNNCLDNQENLRSLPESGR
jgi:hypothetical protein